MRWRLVCVTAVGALWSCLPPPPPEAPICTTTTPPPLAAADCRAEASDYMQRVGAALGEALMDVDSAPGAARVRVAFDPEAGVASSCVHETFGKRARYRLPGALARVSQVAGAPACLAGRRVEIAWQNTIVTRRFLRDVERECRAELRLAKGEIYFCYSAQDCPIDDVLALWGEIDSKLRACMLREVPLALRFAGAANTEHFVPASSEPSPERAIAALEQCPAAHPAQGRACMAEHGFVPLP